MTIREVIDKVNGIKPNQYTDEEKTKWLSDLDFNIYNDILLTHEPVPCELFTHYSVKNTDKELIAREPYDELYVAYLKMKIDEANEETAKYNNSAMIFNAHLDNFARFYNKHFMPVNKARWNNWRKLR